MAVPAKRRNKGRAPARPETVLLVLCAFALGLLLLWLVARHAREEPKPPSPQRLSMEEARRINAAIPFVTNERSPAKPFHFRGTLAAREQAIQCLATAALYEAGSDERGQKAVIQVALNRVRLPHYPKTVCGVVYQGATRTTGCQFSFTCDGSLTRRPEHAGWPAARTAAKRALSGYVFVPVGQATHYHTDWMVPYWIPSLDKIAQIDTHIFYRPPAHPR